MKARHVNNIASAMASIAYGHDDTLWDITSHATTCETLAESLSDLGVPNDLIESFFSIHSKHKHVLEGWVQACTAAAFVPPPFVKLKRSGTTLKLRESPVSGAQEYYRPNGEWRAGFYQIRGILFVTATTAEHGELAVECSLDEFLKDNQ